MNIAEIVDMLKQENPRLFTNIPENRATALIRNTLVHLRDHIDDSDEGVLRVQAFGNFRIRQVEREKSGSTVTERRIIFTPAKARSVSRG